MSYLENTRIATKRDQWFRRMFAAALLVGLAIGFLLGAFVVLMLGCPALPPDTVPSQTVTPAPEESVYLGKCKVMAYCACEICCGKWAKNRPDGIVYGASGEELVAGNLASVVKKVV